MLPPADSFAAPVGTRGTVAPLADRGQDRGHQHAGQPSATHDMTSAEDIEDAPAELAPAAARVYLDARARGLCHEGAMEVALAVPARDEDRRLEALEFKVAHLEKAVQELSDVVYRQQQQLDAALALNLELRRQLAEIGGRTSDPTAVEIPPHY
jgi:SlyX protein